MSFLREQITDKGRYKTRLLESATNHDFIEDERFIASMESATGDLERKYGTHGPWSFHVLLWVASQAVKLPGDIVQCGVFAGTDAAAIIAYTNFQKQKKSLYLLDTYTGIPEELLTPREVSFGALSAQWLYKEVGDLYPSVVHRFRDYQNVHVIRGRVPDTLELVESSSIAALLLDMNNAAPEIAAMEYFWDRIVPGGIIFSDDYGHCSKKDGYYEQKLAFDAFAARVGLEVLNLPTGQGMIIKV